MKEMKDSGIAWIGEIPADWKMVRNKNAFTSSKELVGEKSEFTQLLSLTTRGIKKKDINNAEGKLPESFDTYQLVKENDIVMCLFDLDCSAVFSGISPYEGMISPAYRVLSCKECMEPRYADYWFKYISDGRKFNHYAKNIRYTLSYEEFSALPLPLPEKSEQRRIADYLDRKCSQIDAIIARQQEVIEKLKAYKLSIITEAVTKGLNPDVPMKDSGVEWIGEIPQFATVTCVKHLYEIVLGKMLSPTPKSEEDTLESYFCAANVHFSDIDYNNLKTMWFSKEERRNYHVSLGDLLIVEGGAGAGGAHIIEKSLENCYIQNSIMIARTKTTVTNKWLYYTLYSLVKREYVEYVCNKATIPHFTKDKLGNTPVVLFPGEIEETIIVFLDEKCRKIDKLISKKEQGIDKLIDYKKSLIYEVVTGKKEV